MENSAESAWRRSESPITTDFIGINGQSTQLENAILVAKTAKSSRLGRGWGRLGKMSWMQNAEIASSMRFDTMPDAM
jgi:hypothetical protein